MGARRGRQILRRRALPGCPRPSGSHLSGRYGLQTEPGAVLPQNYPLVAYYRGYARMRLGQAPNEDFRKASEQSTLYVLRAGFEVLETGTGGEALLRVEQDRP